jgi:hypothetical protein
MMNGVGNHMTGPALDLINYIFKTKDGVEILEASNTINTILIRLEITKKENLCCDWPIVLLKQKTSP